MNNNFGLPERTITELLEYFRTRPEIEKVVVYGSRAKGTYRKGSDIDFAIWSDKENISEIVSDLDELPTPYCPLNTRSTISRLLLRSRPKFKSHSKPLGKRT